MRAQDVSPPSFVLRMLDEAAGRVSEEKLYDRLLRFPEEGPNSLDARMMPFQREGVRWVAWAWAWAWVLRGVSERVWAWAWCGV